MHVDPDYIPAPHHSHDLHHKKPHSIVVVLGATGIVGSGVVKHFLQFEHVAVVAPVRGDPKKLLDQLDELGNSKRLSIPIFHYGERDGAFQLAKWIQDHFHQKIDHVFCVGGGVAPMVPISRVTDEQWRDTNENKILPHLFAAQALLPLLKDEESSSFTFVTGLLGEACFAPQYALTTIANSAIYGLVLAVQAEHKHNYYRINEMRISAIITLDDLEENPTFPGMPAAKTSRLAQFYHENIVQRHHVRDTIVRVNGSDVGL